MLNKIKIILDKNDTDYTRILEMLLFNNCNAKITNYEDDDQFTNSKTVIICDRDIDVENVLSANNYKYTYC